MRKPKDKCEIRLSQADVMKAIEDYINDSKHVSDTECISVKTSQSKDYILIAEIE